MDSYSKAQLLAAPHKVGPDGRLIITREILKYWQAERRESERIEKVRKVQKGWSHVRLKDHRRFALSDATRT
jgi:hypothetical protein